jgi:hypothetical protein
MYKNDIEQELEDLSDIPVPEKMTEDDLKGIVKSEVDDAITWQEGWLSSERAALIDYYHGRPFGNEEAGRSQVVSTDIRDTIHAIMPPLMRIFFGGESVVEFTPNGPEDEAHAKQATEYINYIFQNDNNGFKLAYEAFKDALLLKTGIIKYWWEDDLDVSTWDLTGLGDDDLAVLSADPEVEFSIDSQSVDEFGQNVYALTVTRTRSNGRVKLASVPPEEFIVSPRATDVRTAPMVGHRRQATVSELVEMGYDYDEVLEHAGSDKLETSQEREARRLDNQEPFYDAKDDAMKLVSYVEAYMYVDYNGDGVAELRKICMIGSACDIVANEEIAFHPFVDLCPDPEPHTWLGNGVADVVDDIQRIKSMIMRNMLDSLALSTTPRMTVVEGQVNLDDVLNTEIGAIIRQRNPGAVQALETPFVGQHAFTALQYMDDLRENRTGITKAAVGLDPDALQSTTKAGVAATITAAHERVELIARIFAECGIGPLFTGILKLVIMHQDAPRTVRLRNEWQDVDPRAWDATMDVTVNVGLGTGDLDTKMQFLSMIAQKQESIIGSMGPDNPVSGLAQYRNTLASMAEMMGFRNPGKFFTDPANWQPPQQQPPAPDPNLIIAEAEAMKAQAEIQNDAARLALDREEMLRKDDLERDKLDAEIALKAAEIRAKHQGEVDVAQIKADIERQRSQDSADAQIIGSLAGRGL